VAGAWRWTYLDLPCKKENCWEASKKFSLILWRGPWPKLGCRAKERRRRRRRYRHILCRCRIAFLSHKSLKAHLEVWHSFKPAVIFLTGFELCFGAEVKECVELYLHSHNTPSWHGAQLKKHRDNFASPLPYLIRYESDIPALWLGPIHTEYKDKRPVTHRSHSLDNNLQNYPNVSDMDNINSINVTGVRQLHAHHSKAGTGTGVTMKLSSLRNVPNCPRFLSTFRCNPQFTSVAILVNES
jgi:hypothetical protein